MSEDYAGAFIERSKDVATLLATVYPEMPRCVGAIHMGGIAIECRLKAILLKHHGLDCFHPSGGTVTNPGHDLMSAFRRIPLLWKLAKQDSLVTNHLQRLIRPLGNTDIDYIDIRYSAASISDTNMKEWKKSYQFIQGWISKNSNPIL